MNVDITKRLEWLSKRIDLTEQDKDYIRFAMLEVVTDALMLVKNCQQIIETKTKKCDWCNKRKKINDMYRLGKLKETDIKEYWICSI